MRERLALVPRDEGGSGDPAGYLRRNLSTAYRLAVMVTDDAEGARDVVFDAMLAAWQAGNESPASMDATLRRTLDSGCRAALEASGPDTGDEAEPLAANLRSLSSDDRVALAWDFGISDVPPEPKPGRFAFHAARPRSAKALDRLEALTAGRSSDGVPAAGHTSIEARLRSLYASRDPGLDPPPSLRFRLQKSLYEAETGATERRRHAAANGWGFAINTVLVISVLTMVVALASVTSIRSSQAAASTSGGGPTAPLTITSVATVQSGVGGPAVHVAATSTSLVATFAGSPDWHPDARQCLPDVVGTIDSSGQAQWLDQPAGHVLSLTGDPSSVGLYAAVLGPYCQAGSSSSGDGGKSWASGGLPSGATDSPAWMAFDPVQAGTLVAASDGKLFISRDSGASWQSGPNTLSPIGFNSAGLLSAWGPEALFASRDDGSTWQQIGTGPATQPIAGAALPGGLLLGEPDGLWWYPTDATPTLVRPGGVFSIAPAGDGAVVLGSDAVGHPYLGAFSIDGTDSPLRTVALPQELAALTVAGGQVAANSTGAVIALSGANAAIAFATFAH